MSSLTYGLSKNPKQNETVSPPIPVRPILTQQSTSPVSSTKSNGILNSPSPKMTSPSVSLIY